MKPLRVIFGLIVLVQLAIALKLFPDQGDIGFYTTISGIFYKTLGFVLFFEFLLARARLPQKIHTVIYGAAILAYLGEAVVQDLNLYQTTLWADVLAHFSAPILLSFMGYLIVISEKTTKAFPYKKYMVLTTLCLIMVLHEIYELGSDKIFGTQQIGIDDPVYDTAQDLFWGFLGTVTGLFAGTAFEKYFLKK